jgi:murein L,D-transpeptidase YcbB/YkuD
MTLNGHDKRLSPAVKRTEQVVQLPTGIPVHLLYWSAWTDENGLCIFVKISTIAIRC